MFFFKMIMWNSSSIDFVPNMFKVIGIEGMIWDLEVEKGFTFPNSIFNLQYQGNNCTLEKMFLICVCTKLEMNNNM